MYKELTVSIPDDPRFEKMLLSVVRDMNNRYRESKEREKEKSSSSSSSPIPLLIISISKDKDKEKKEIPYSILSTSNIDLPLPTLDILIDYAVYMGMTDTFDVNAFYNYMEKRAWRDANGEVIKNWAKVIDSSYQKGKFKGFTQKPNKPKELPYSLYGDADYFEI